MRDSSIKQVQDTDFTLAQRGDFDHTYVKDVSRGAGRNLIAKVKTKHPEWIVPRRSGKTTIDAVPQRHQAAFKTFVRENGARERAPDIQEIQPNDLPLSRTVIRDMFKGKRVGQVQDEVAARLQAEHPEWFYNGKIIRTP